MHRLDAQLQLLDSELEGVDGVDEDSVKAIKAQIRARENDLKAVYTQVATEFADLHDKTGRMKAKGVIKQAVPWNRSREFFFYLAQRRILEDDFIKQIRKADPTMTNASAADVFKSMFKGDWDDDKAVIEFFTTNSATIHGKIVEVKKSHVEAKIKALQEELNLM
jgi:acetyl-CoA carboxylase/biotin carboxylase 1